MNQNIIPLLEKARRFLAKYGLQEVNWGKLNQEGISLKEMVENFNGPEELVTVILQQERQNFEGIFKRINVTNYNAIDVLLLVSKEINDNLFYITPTITHELKDLFPDIYNNHFIERENFINRKIKDNIRNGKNQAIYKDDLIEEDTTNIILSHIEHLYNTEVLSGDGFSFTTIIERFLNTYIKIVANEDGLNYYRNRKQLYGALGFGW